MQYQLPTLQECSKAGTSCRCSEHYIYPTINTKYNCEQLVILCSITGIHVYHLLRDATLLATADYN